MSGLSTSLRKELTKERKQLKDRLVVLAREIKIVNKTLVSIDTMLGGSREKTPAVVSEKNKRVTNGSTGGTRYRQRDHVMPKGEANKWVCCLLGRLKTASYAASVVKIAESHLPMMLRGTGMTEKQLYSRVTALLYQGEIKKFVKVDRGNRPFLYALTQEGHKLYTDNEKYIRKLMA